MKPYRVLFVAAALTAAGMISSFAQTPNLGGFDAIATNSPATNGVTSAPVYVPDSTHRNDPLPDGVFDFDATTKSVDAVEGTDFAHFSFTFTNITTNIIAILEIHPGCGCTTAEVPAQMPWVIQPGESDTFKLSVNLAGKVGTLFKTVDFYTEKGKRTLMLRINLTPPPVVKMTDEEKLAGIIAAKADRQAVFKGDCASCHMKNLEGKFGQELFKSACSICHEAPERATMVPDLAKLMVPTSDEFWRTWATYGKPGSLMPAWAKSQGGPLDDAQIASLAQYLNAVYPTKVKPVGQ